MAGIMRATVQTVDTLNQLGLLYDNGLGALPPARPFLGGAASGYHAAPAIGDQVAALFDETRRIVGTTSTTATPATLLALLPGESVQLAADGRKIGYLKSNGDTTIFTNAAGTLVLTIAHSTSNIAITTPGRVDVTATNKFFVNGTQVGP